MTNTAKQLSSEQIARRFGELEHMLHEDDPSLARRMQKLRRANTRHEVAVFSLLTISAVLLAAAFATLSVPVGLAGVAAYLGSFVVDTRRSRILGAQLDQDRQPPSPTGHQLRPATVATTPSTPDSTRRDLAPAVRD